MEKFLVKPAIYYGQDSLRYLYGLKGQKACIVTEKVMVELGLVDQVTRILDERNITYEVFTESVPNPPLELVEKGLTHIIQGKPDLLIAVGGGSAIDAAKAIMLCCLKTKEQFVNPDEIHKPWFVAIPTTSGTGSEVTSYSVITDTKSNKKLVLIDDVMLPDAAVLDIRFTKSVPPNVTADTGMDVLTHAIEAYVSKKANDYTDIYAEKAIRLTFGYLLKAYRDGANEEARQKMHNASCMAGIAFNNASLGINHSLAHVLGSKFKLPHGKSNAILMPYVIHYNSGIDDNNLACFGAAAKYAALAKLMRLPASTVREGVTSLCEAVKYFNRELNIPVTVKEAGIERLSFENSLEEMAETALADLCTPGNPRKANKSDLINILRQAYGS